MAENSGGLVSTLGFRILPEAEEGVVEAEMEVTPALSQPFGFCSGGAFLALEETLAGVGSRRISGEDALPLGIQVSANHVKAVPVGGRVRAVARALQRGYRIQVWNVDLFNEAGELVSSARVTNAVKRGLAGGGKAA